MNVEDRLNDYKEAQKKIKLHVEENSAIHSEPLDGPLHQELLRLEKEGFEVYLKLEDARATVRTRIDKVLNLPPDQRMEWQDTDGIGWKKGSDLDKYRDEALKWLRAKVHKGPRLTPRPIVWKSTPGMRAQAKPLLIELADTDPPHTIVHEHGHHVEMHAPGAEKAAQEFLAHRIGTQSRRKLNDVIPGNMYKDWEEGADDDFAKVFGRDMAWYAGKHYSSGSTELLSMGLELLYTDPVEFAKKDPEYCAFVIGILDGSLRKP